MTDREQNILLSKQNVRLLQEKKQLQHEVQHWRALYAIEHQEAVNSRKARQEKYKRWEAEKHKPFSDSFIGGLLAFGAFAAIITMGIISFASWLRA